MANRTNHPPRKGIDITAHKGGRSIQVKGGKVTPEEARFLNAVKDMSGARSWSDYHLWAASQAAQQAALGMGAQMTAYQVTYQIAPGDTLTAIRFAPTLDAARESAARVLEVEQGYRVISVEETPDPRSFAR